LTGAAASREFRVWGQIELTRVGVQIIRFTSSRQLRRRRHFFIKCSDHVGLRTNGHDLY